MTSRNGRGAKITEWPTLLLAALIYGGWAATVWFHNRLPLWMLMLIGGWLVAWHGSLQHETIHGHPTNSARLNALIGALPLALWLPYESYRREHVAHHATPDTTNPIEDPESRYLLPAAGGAARLRHILARLQAPLIGRLLIGPIDLVLTFLWQEALRLRRSPGAVLKDWAPHALGLAIVGTWLALSHMNIGLYLLAFVYPGTALSLLRSFAEHRAAEAPGHRVAIVERAGPFALLFLNNNLHAAHHSAPGITWFRLPAFYRTHREAILHDNGNLLYRGYAEIARRYAFRPHDVLVHPHL